MTLLNSMIAIVDYEIPGMSSYAAVLKAVGDLDHGRVRAQVQNTIFLHSTVVTRDLVRSKGLDFYTLQNNAAAFLKGTGILRTPESTTSYYLILHARMRAVVTGDYRTFDDMFIAWKRREAEVQA
jgi:hypothetical protein